MKTIYHLGAFSGANLGDEAIKVAMRDALNEMAAEPLEWVTVDCQSTRCDRRWIDELNERADLLIVGGGGLLWDRPENQSVSGWQWNIATEDVPRIRVAFVLYALGWTAFPYRDGTGAIGSPIRDSVMAVCLDASAVSVRDWGSARKLAAVTGKVEVVPDPAYFLRREPHHVRTSHTRRTAVCIAGDRDDWRWRTPEHKAYFMRELARMLSDRDCYMVSHHPSDQGSTAVANPYQLADFYASMDLVLGMRKHSLIIPTGQGVPTIGLGEMDEVAWLCEMHGMPVWRDNEWCWPERDAPIPPDRRAFDDFNRRTLQAGGIAVREPALVSR